MADSRGGSTPRTDHATHDPELIVALLDEDLSDAERAAGMARVEICADCARLHDDLLALAGSTQALSTPARTRDFRLTPADAERLTREPIAAPTRLTGVMTDPRTASAHASHDTMLVASLADHSLAPNDRVAAERLVADCSLCAALHDDLLAIRIATIELPTPPRLRDYQLTQADAARLRRPSWRRWVAALGSPRDTFTRPLAVGLTTLGIIGILVSGAPWLSFGSATSGPAENVPAAAPPVAGGGTGAAVAAAAPSAAATDAASAVKDAGQLATAAPQPVYATQPSAEALPVVPPPTNPGFEADQAGAGDTATARAQASSGAGVTNPVDLHAAQAPTPVDSTSGVSPLIVLSGVLLVSGLGLFLLRWMARRVGA